MGEDSDMHDEDLECLPDIFENINGSEEKVFEVVQGDIVWAEFRNLYWPALVRQVFKKDKKVSIWYLDSPKKCFKLPMKRIKNFKCPDISAKIRKEVETSNVKQKHESTMFRTLDYIRRKADGEQNDPAKFFDLNCPYLVLNSCPLVEEANDSVNTVEAKVDAFDENEPEEDIDDYLLNKSEEGESLNESSNEETNKIVSIVVSGKIDKCLLKIRNNRLDSKWQKVYNETSDTKLLMYQVSYTPVQSYTALKDMSTHLMNLFEREVGGCKDEMVVYVTSVWLPEAIEKALSLLSGDFLENDEKIDSTPPDKIPKAEKSTKKPSKSTQYKDKKYLQPKQAKRKLKFEKNHVAEPAESDKTNENDHSFNSYSTSEILSDDNEQGIEMKISKKKKGIVKTKPSAPSINVKEDGRTGSLRNRARICYTEYDFEF